MPSEKMRYIRSRSGPSSPIEFDKLQDHLRSLDSAHLIEILQGRAQRDEILRRVLTLAVAIRSSAGDYEKGKAAINFGLFLPDFIRYNEGGHGQILDEIKSAIQFLAENNYRECAVRLAQYTIKRAEELSERFEDDWDWRSSLDHLIGCAEKLKAESEV